MEREELDLLKELMTIGLSLAAQRERDTGESHSKVIDMFKKGMEVVDGIPAHKGWKSDELKKVFDRLILGKSDMPDGVLAGKLKLINDSLSDKER